jgi:hypothetical protein
MENIPEAQRILRNNQEMPVLVTAMNFHSKAIKGRSITPLQADTADCS